MIEARRREQKPDADERVDPLPFQVGDGVAVPERGRGRRRAVDHDETERDEPERDEDEQALLELSARG